MPLYEYQCDACDHRFERIQKFSDPPVEVCPQCGAREVQKLLSSPAIQFKGSGWYITDYAKKGGDSKESGESGKAKESGESKESRESRESGKSKESGTSKESRESTKPAEPARSGSKESTKPAAGTGSTNTA